MKTGSIKAGALRAWKKSRFGSLAVVFALTLGAIFGSTAALAETKTTHSIHTASHHFYAATHHREYASRGTHSYRHYAYASHHLRYAHYGYRHGLRYASARYRYSRLQCVPYAREVSHIQLSGDAFLWWAEASGRYARGNLPIEGAVLNFRSIRRMPLGHVAVVTAVVGSRTILVTQANWVPGSITNDVTMQDVSPNNDWSAVEVELGDSSRWGAAYPTYGFIYNQPDGTAVTGSSTTIASAAPDATQGDEVAEAPKPPAISNDAPDRNLQ